MLTVTLPYPISANRYWKSFPLNGRTMTAPSSEAKAYKRDVGFILRGVGVTSPIEGRVAVHIDLYPKRPQDWESRKRKLGENWDDGVQCLDIDNARKVLYDALKGIAIVDDKWIWSDSARRCEPDGEARVVVTIREVAAVKSAAQPALFDEVAA
ncbi:RusA family crossover junction endodeoxyribonuclease [Paraburkholderia sp. CNPSo 3274]|uniref:RusA family crossover junction endodeoxyribonuclease n=1 Tax=Paraburkholderia sp. CNPSo 3274 TaxID=2940932 RepID=UPI0020B693E0|nr:RusA family crossover junction endodeoxyribonuclease [Paraburkholderia sp. CNPSo 3274]MCP3709748.1 RusA family crossover junction endodeoxyribonuclease [Paraburkholderia sp. CNPSo 3274]